MDKLSNICKLENISPMAMMNPFKFSIACMRWQENMIITVFTWGNDREPSAAAPFESSAEWVHSWMTSCQEDPGGSGLCSLTSCWFLTKGTSLGLILLSFILVQIRSCINSYREVLFILPEPSLSVQGLTASVFEAWSVTSSYIHQGEGSLWKTNGKAKAQNDALELEPIQQVNLPEEGRSTREAQTFCPEPLLASTLWACSNNWKIDTQ